MDFVYLNCIRVHVPCLNQMILRIDRASAHLIHLEIGRSKTFEQEMQ